MVLYSAESEDVSDDILFGKKFKRRVDRVDKQRNVKIVDCVDKFLYSVFLGKTIFSKSCVVATKRKIHYMRSDENGSNRRTWRIQ